MRHNIFFYFFAVKFLVLLIALGGHFSRWCRSTRCFIVNVVIYLEDKKTPEGVYAGWIGWSKNYVEWRACLIKTRNGEMIKWRNGETVLLKVRVKVVGYNPSNKTIERINKRTQQSRFLFQFVLVTLHICAALHLIQTSSVAPFLCKVHVCQIPCIKFIAKWVPF